jgi:hypothetical protein
MDEQWVLWGQDFNGGFVPVSHSFNLVIERYLRFREVNPNNMNLPDFGNWLIENPDIPINAPGGAAACQYPLGPNQLGIAGLSDEEVWILANFPNGHLARCFLKNWRCVDVHNELPRCIADIYIAGRIGEQGLVGEAAANMIVNLGFAGAYNAAQAILTVGRSVGLHFGFLDENYQPTEFFNEYFGN